jgi:putative two-component system response regulator
MTDQPFKILLVDDDEPTRDFMKLVLEMEGYDVLVAEDGAAAYDAVKRQKVDLVLSDVMMPRMTGIELCAKIKKDPDLELLPVILCTALSQDCDRLEGLEAGADDFLTKPVDEAEIKLRLRNFVRVVTLQQQVKRGRLDAERMVEERTEELRETIHRLEEARAEIAIAQLDVIYRLAAATEYKDADTGAHIQRIAEYTARIARCLGWFSDEEIATISHASMMHDLGKIGIPDYILMKPGLLTSEEFEEMKKHTTIGWRLLSGSLTPLLQIASRIAHCHHEKWDGSGYPEGLIGEAIPPEARIVAVVDVFDALRAQRCYKPEYPLHQCFEMIRARAGTHFDPEVVEAFLLVSNELADIDIGLADAA